MRKGNYIIKEDPKEQSDGEYNNSLDQSEDGSEQSYNEQNEVCKNITYKQSNFEQFQKKNPKQKESLLQNFESDINKENDYQKIDYSSDEDKQNMKPKMKHIERPKSSCGIVNQKNTAGIQKSTVFNGQQSKVMNRPDTANPYKPVYKMPMGEFQIMNKQYDYKKKTFSTVRRKTDPVSRYQNLNKGWKNSKFLQSNNMDGKSSKQGRKLQLSERIASSQPEYIFHKYLNKDQTKMMF